MECHDVVERAVERLADPAAGDPAGIDVHLESCERCRAEIEAIESAWVRLGADPDAVMEPAFRRETRAMLEAETLRRRIAPMRVRRWMPALQAAAMLAAGAGGFLLARAASSGRTAPAPASPAATVAAAPSLPDLSKQPKLANVAFRPADASGRVGISFDVTTRYTVEGKPGDKEVSDLLAYMVSGSGATEGARGKAIDLVSQHYATQPTASPQIVATLADTLRNDRNPGVRKKAAEALAQLPPSPAIRDAFLAALKSDTNPAVRIAAVDGLAKSAITLRDPAAIETLREKASDDKETGFVRVKAAKALQRVDL
ncbi:MAG TPA: HEAT repeat domain-containing protein [Thermoanaerobaculia bacterium]|nr:HEAT repeat domain-containing protein [Thermoanaerobaculia bacterium]